MITKLTKDLVLYTMRKHLEVARTFVPKSPTVYGAMVESLKEAIAEIEAMPVKETKP